MRGATYQLLGDNPWMQTVMRARHPSGPDAAMDASARTRVLPSGEQRICFPNQRRTPWTVHVALALEGDATLELVDRRRPTIARPPEDATSLRICAPQRAHRRANDVESIRKTRALSRTLPVDEQRAGVRPGNGWISASMNWMARVAVSNESEETFGELSSAQRRQVNKSIRGKLPFYSRTRRQMPRKSHGPSLFFAKNVTHRRVSRARRPGGGLRRRDGDDRRLTR